MNKKKQTVLGHNPSTSDMKVVNNIYNNMMPYCLHLSYFHNLSSFCAVCI